MWTWCNVSWVTSGARCRLWQTRTSWKMGPRRWSLPYAADGRRFGDTDLVGDLGGAVLSPWRGESVSCRTGAVVSAGGPGVATGDVPAEGNSSELSPAFAIARLLRDGGRDCAECR